MRRHLNVPTLALLSVVALLSGCEERVERGETGAESRQIGGDLDVAGRESPPESERPADGADPDALTPDGWRNLRIGMTRDEVVAAAGGDAYPERVGGPEPERCDEFRPRRAPEGLLVMIEDGRLTRIAVARDADIRTERGFGVGDSGAAIREAYGAEAEITPHKYVGGSARYITVWRTPPPADDARGLVYETGADGRVVRIIAGGPSIRYVEGCL